LLQILKVKTEEIEDISYVSHPQTQLSEVKPKLEPFTGNVQSLSIRPVEIPDIKPRRRQKKFNCDLCQKGVGTKGGLIYHMKAHLNGRPFKCKTCKRSYSTKNDFDTHNKRHAGLIFTCDYCTRNFSTKQYLADHISTIHLPKVLKCQYCKNDKYFSAVKALRIHQMMCHFVAMSDQLTVYSCTMGCGYKTTIRSSFESHELLAKKMGYRCKICLKTYSCYKFLIEHLKTEKKSLVKCKICNGSFKNIRGHIKQFHTSQKTRVCDFCNFKTSSGNSFSSHSKQCATQEKLRSKGHLCIICDKFFYSVGSLERHHSNKHGSIFCSICPARFNQKRAHTNHMRKHKENPIRCLCPKFPMFPNIKAFNSHFNSVHRTMRVTKKAFFGLCLICWEGKKKKVVCKFKNELENHMLLAHLKRLPQKILTVTLE
jgi:KRAB domain-containing zinc finger protein